MGKLSKKRTKKYESVLPKGPNGRNLCRCDCGREVEGRRRTFYSDECVHQYRLRSDRVYLRGATFDRDQGICKSCGLDTKILQKVLDIAEILDQKTVHFLMQRLFGRIYTRMPALWHADHILPVADGGGECGLENIQTLCHWCHAPKTAAENSARAKQRAKS